jgi:DNA-binding NtrC family response regulator
VNDRPSILIIEDDEILAASLTTRLMLEEMQPIRVSSCTAALEELRTRRFDAVVSDIRLPDGSGADVFWSERDRFAMTPIIFATAYGDIEEAVGLVKAGATDYLTKPYDLGALIDRLRRLTRDGGDPGTHDALSSSVPAMARLEAALDRLADTPQNVLLVGAPGSGRQTLARRLHAASARRDAPFVVVEGASLNAPAGDRLLFGAASADGGDEPGLVDRAGNGTLLFTDIGAIAPDVQARLSRFVEEHRYRPIGAVAERTFQGRIMATADTEPLDAAGPAGARSDLMLRFGVIELRVPPLVEREGDVLPLAERILETTVEPNPAIGRQRFTADAAAALENYDWPGNIRELRNRVVRAALLCEGEEISVADLFPDVAGLGSDADQTLDATRRDAERHAIEAALAENHGRIVDTARSLGISRVTLWSKMKQMGISKPTADRGKSNGRDA